MVQHYKKMAELGLSHVMKSNVPDYGVVRFFFTLQLWQKMNEFSNEAHCNFIYVLFIFIWQKVSPLIFRTALAVSVPYFHFSFYSPFSRQRSSATDNSHTFFCVFGTMCFDCCTSSSGASHL
jgi:hypothetical protein